jgi:hypothetical protein
VAVIVPINKPPVGNTVSIQCVLAERSIASAAACPKLIEKHGSTLFRQGITEWIPHYQSRDFGVVFATGTARIRESVEENRPSTDRICGPKQEQ